jgi:glyoxylase-like metal-dependent hydrolase (beta-lactamase superfamily II)
VADVATPEYEVTIVRFGTREATRSDVYLNYPVYGEDDGPIRMDYFFWVVRNQNETILVDTGFGRRAGEARGRTVLLDPAEAFERVGVAPGTSPRIIITHAHWDHIGNLNLFPDAEIVMSRKEFDFWAGPNGGKPLFVHSVEADELASLRRAADEGRVSFFEGEVEVAPGVRVLEIGGHTPGQSVVFVKTSQGQVLLASDAVHYYEEFERDKIFTSVADLVEMYDSFAMIRELLASGEVQHVVSGHDPSTLDRFTAATGALEGQASTIGAVRSVVAAVGTEGIA